MAAKHLTNATDAGTLPARKGSDMDTMTFTASLMAADAADAIARAGRHVAKLDGFSLTGRVACRAARHLLWDVEVAGSGDVDNAWVVLTSYGMTPGEELGSVWQTVPGVGTFA